MKKVLALTAFVLVVAFATVLTGCNYPTESDFVPQKLGISDDGLWLYQHTTRTRSDGSGKESLPLEMQINGEEAEITDWLQTTDAHTLFYALTNGNDKEQLSALYVYDYEEKRSEELIPATNGGISLDHSENYVFAQTYKTKNHIYSTDKAYLFDYEGNVIFDATGYSFDDENGILKSVKKEQDLAGMKNRISFRYWYEGTEGEVALMTDAYLSGEYTAGGWNYFIFMDGRMIAVDLTSGEQKEGKLPAKDDLLHFDDYVYTVDGVVFVFFYREVEREGLDGAEMYALKNGEVMFLRSFGETSVRCSVRCYVRGSLPDQLVLDLTERNLAKSRLYVGASLEFFQGDPPEEEAEALQKFTCGEYTFWETRRSWTQGFMTKTNYCYYLWRQKGDEEPEIMQYAFCSGNGYSSLFSGFFYFDILPV